MSSYLIIVLLRFLEIIARFSFLGQSLKLFNLEIYGEVSYKMAFYQFGASILYSGSLQSLSKYQVENHDKKNAVMTTLFLLAFIFSLILYLVDGPASLIFLFYSLLYIENGWFGSSGDQIIFNCFRSISFTAQAIFFFIPLGPDLQSHFYFSFGISSLTLLISIPIKNFNFQLLPLTDWQNFIKFQAHNLTFQLTKISERWVFKFILDKKTFGLYSSIRDLINAANLTFFSPMYQVYYKRLSQGEDYSILLRRSLYFIVSVMSLGLIINEFFGIYILELFAKYGVLKFNKLYLSMLIILFSLDFLRSLQMMIFEARHRFKTLFQSHLLDFIFLGMSLLFIFSDLSDTWKLYTVLLLRLVTINSFFKWKKRSL